MAIPKSKKLMNEEDQKPRSELPAALIEPLPEVVDGPIQVREIGCLNDFVAILQLEHAGVIARPDDSKLKNEGLVVGVGPGAPDGAGGRLMPQVKIGDVVMFSGKPITAIDSQSPPYSGKRVAIISERNLICLLPTKIEIEIYEENA